MLYAEVSFVWRCLGLALKIAKFGGSSLATAEQFQKVYNIVKGDPEIHYVVPSAPGKCPGHKEKVTDLLYACAYATSPYECDEIFDRIERRYREIVRDLGLALDLTPYLDTARRNIRNGFGLEYAASRGEYLNGVILAKYLGFEFIDAASCIAFCEDGSLDEELTHDHTRAMLATAPYAVIPGFYGLDNKNRIRTFTRGGSDITGAIVARAANADIYENWTDVSGFLKADPRIIPNPMPIRYISYSELRELSYMGASVLHDEAIFPVKEAKIPINIRNTNDPSHPGTMILPSVPEEAYDSAITGIAGRTGFTSIVLEKNRMNNEIGFAMRALSALAEEGVSLEHMPTGIDTLSLVVSTQHVEGKLGRILKKLQAVCQPDRMDVQNNLALIATVGHGMHRRIGICAALFTALAQAGVNVRLLDQGSSELNIIVGVDESDFETAMRAIYSGLAPLK